MPSDLGKMAEAVLGSMDWASAVLIIMLSGIFMRRTTQTPIATIGALGLYAFAQIGIKAAGGGNAQKLTDTSVSNFLNLPMGTFLIYFAIFLTSIFMVHSVKAVIQK